jgi:CubicO group peptidase (beta-lactamase class C family)
VKVFRKQMNPTLILILIAFVLSLVSCYQSAESSLDRRIRRVENGLLSAQNDPPWKRMSLEERMAFYNVPGVSIAVIDEYQVEWAKGYGVLQPGQKEPVTPETLLQTGSIAKPVVTVAALNAVERGLVDLDGDVNQSLVSWRIPDNEFTVDEKVTLRRLLSHSAGVAAVGFRGYAQGEEIPTMPQIMNGDPPANSPPVRVEAVPWTQWLYSNGGYMIVQQLLEDVTGRPFSDYMQEVVLEPWGLAASTFEWPLPEDRWEIAASGHRVDGRVIPGRWHTYPEMGSGASMWSTPTDMAQFAIALMNSYNGLPDQVLSQDMAIQMLSPQFEEWGLGLFLGDDGGDRFYFMHDGANDGYETVMVGYPQRGQGVVIMTNADSGAALWQEILNSVSVEYGLVSDNTYLYVGTALAIGLAVLGILLLRRKK